MLSACVLLISPNYTNAFYVMVFFFHFWLNEWYKCQVARRLSFKGATEVLLEHLQRVRLGLLRLGFGKLGLIWGLVKVRLMGLGKYMFVANGFMFMKRVLLWLLSVGLGVNGISM